MPIATPEQIERYEAAPSQIIATLDGLDETQLHYRPAEGEWSIHEIVIHLADSEAVGYWRIRKVLAEPDPLLAVYDEAAWAQKLSYRTQSRELAIALFTSLRASTAALLRSLPAEDWERTGVHPEHCQMTINDLLNLYIKHGEVHLQQIAHIKQAFSTIV